MYVDGFTGSQTSVEIGDLINVTCVSGASKPAPKMAWFINGDMVSNLYETEDLNEMCLHAVCMLSAMCVTMSMISMGAVFCHTQHLMVYQWYTNG